jgi:ribosomal protein S19E (S16A)
MKSQQKVAFEELIYLIKGVQERMILWEDVANTNKLRKIFPSPLRKLIKEGFFKKAGNNKSCAYITETGRAHLDDIIHELLETAPTIVLKRKFTKTKAGRERYYAKQKLKKA